MGIVNYHIHLWLQIQEQKPHGGGFTKLSTTPDLFTENIPGAMMIPGEEVNKEISFALPRLFDDRYDFSAEPFVEVKNDGRIEITYNTSYQGYHIWYIYGDLESKPEIFWFKGDSSAKKLNDNTIPPHYKEALDEHANWVLEILNNINDNS